MKKKMNDYRGDFLATMLEATNKGTIKWEKVKDKSYWETHRGDNWVVFHPADNGCVSMNYSVNGRSGLFNIWPDDKEEVILGTKLNEIITGEYKKEMKAQEVKRATLAQIANMFLQ